MTFYGSWTLVRETDDAVSFTMSLKFLYRDQGDWNFNYTFDQIAQIYEAYLNTCTVYGWLFGTSPYLISITSETKTIKCSYKKSSNVIMVDWPQATEPDQPGGEAE